MAGLEGCFRIYAQKSELMIFYRKNDEIDRDLWDNCIKNSPGFKPYAYSWYLDIMAPGWQALIADNYDSVFPLPGNSRFGINYIATPIFLQQLGVFSAKKLVTNQINEFYASIPDKFKLIDLCVGQKPDSSTCVVTVKSNFELDLSKPYEDLWKNFSLHCRRNIEASLKIQPDLVSDISPDEIIDLFIRNKGKEIQGIKVCDYQRLKNLIDFCICNKKGRMIGVRSEGGQLIFGIFLVETEGNITMLFVVNTSQSREKRIGYYIVNELIRCNADTKTTLDFMGSSIPSIASFMQSFGSLNVPYYRIFRNRLPWPVRFLKQ